MQKRDAAIEAGTYDPLNPWTSNLGRASLGAHSSQEDKSSDESFTKFKKFWEEVNNRKMKDKKILEELSKTERGNSQKQNEEVQEDKKIIGELTTEEMINSEKVIEIKQEDEEQQDKKVAEKVKVVKKKTKKVKVVKKKTKTVKVVKKKTIKERKKPKKINIEEETNTVGRDDGGSKVIMTENDKEVEQKEEYEGINELTSIDEMFDEAEVLIKKKVKRKLNKLGIHTENGETWQTVKRRKKADKKTPSQVAQGDCTQAVPTNTEEFDFTGTKNDTNIDEKLDRVTTLEDIDTLEEDKTTDKIQQAVNTLKKGTATEDSNTADKKSSSTSKAVVDPSKFIQVCIVSSNYCSNLQRAMKK